MVHTKIVKLWTIKESYSKATGEGVYGFPSLVFTRGRLQLLKSHNKLMNAYSMSNSINENFSIACCILHAKTLQNLQNVPIRMIDQFYNFNEELG